MNKSTIIKLSFFILVVFSNSTLYAQIGCKYNGDFNAILSEVKSRNNNAPTAEDKLTDAEAKKVAKYWELDCKCRRGVSSQEQAQALANEAFLNTSNSFTKGNGVNQKKKDLGYLGDLKTPFAVFTPGSCMGSGDNFGSDFESNVNCAPEASRIKNLDGQLGAYASTFFMAYCQCKAGVSSQEEANALIAQMKTNHQNFNTMRNGATQPLSTQPLTSCNIVSGNGNDINRRSGQNKKLIKDEWMGMLNDLAANSENETFKEMVGDINNIKDGVNQLRDFTYSIPGLDMSTTLNDLENITSAFALIDGGIELIGALFKEKEPQYTQSQKEAYKMYQKISNGLLIIYGEINSVPTYYEFNQATLDKVETREGLLDEYNLNTAKQRLLCLEYLLSDGNTLPDMEWFKSTAQQIDDMSDGGAAYKIRVLTSNYLGASSLPLHLYSELGFAGAKNKINKYKVLYYEKAGNNAEAQKYKSKINYNVSYQDAVKLILSSFREENYVETEQYGQFIFDLFRNEKDAALMYTDLPGLNGTPSIYRSDLTKLMVMTIVADVKNNKIAQAKNDLDELILFHERLKNMKLGKKDIFNSNMKSEQVPASEAMVQAAKAYVYSADGKHNEALSEINQAIELYKGKDLLNSGVYSDWLNYLKLEILVAKGDYQESETLLKEIKAQSTLSFSGNRLYPPEKLSFINAFIRYKKEDYNGASIALKIVENQAPNDPKVYALKEKVYLKLNKAEMAEESRTKYIELITKNK